MNFFKNKNIAKYFYQIKILNIKINKQKFILKNKILYSYFLEAYS